MRLRKFERKLTKENILSLENLYNSGLSSWAIAKRFNTYHSNILFHLDKQGIKRRDRSSAAKEGVKAGRIKIKKHSLPRNLNMNENLAYILGVLCGDGYMDYNSKRMTYYIGLDVVDEDFYKRFRTALFDFFRIKPTIEFKKSRNTKWKDQFVTRLCSREVCDYINSIGCFKKDRWRIPKMIKEATGVIKGTFLRGFFDSEGSVDKSSKRISAPSINFEGLNDIQFLLDCLGIRSKIELKKNNNSNRLQIYVIKIQDRKSVGLFYKYIDFSIERKKELLRKVIGNYSYTKILPEELEVRKKEILILKEEGLKFGKIASKLNMNPTTVWRIYNQGQFIS